MLRALLYTTKKFFQAFQTLESAKLLMYFLVLFDDLKILIAALGFPIFEESKKEQGNIFICKRKDVYAEGEYSEDGMTVFKGSKARLQASVNIGSWIKNLRSLLIERGVIKSDDKTYIFQEDYTFHSPSAAAAIVLAVNVNGWNVWKNKKGETLDEKFAPLFPRPHVLQIENNIINFLNPTKAIPREYKFQTNNTF